MGSSNLIFILNYGVSVFVMGYGYTDSAHDINLGALDHASCAPEEVIIAITKYYVCTLYVCTFKRVCILLSTIVGNFMTCTLYIQNFRGIL
jgi:hypothetical protein